MSAKTQQHLAFEKRCHTGENEFSEFFQKNILLARHTVQMHTLVTPESVSLAD